MEINIFVKKLKLWSLSYVCIAHKRFKKRVYWSLRENNKVAEITRKFNFSEICGIEIHDLTKTPNIWERTKLMVKHQQPTQIHKKTKKGVAEKSFFVLSWIHTNIYSTRLSKRFMTRRRSFISWNIIQEWWSGSICLNWKAPWSFLCTSTLNFSSFSPLLSLSSILILADSSVTCPQQQITSQQKSETKVKRNKEL